ncbi:hypothetical protein IQ264_22010 [Phormidium sp. LEGE 05292]|nr:hypothetical protein [Phormidium sp. LEGE 05292]MBE9228100.1 hypothetical protein [Phormidium sp. LEGE 05292]
MLTTFYPMMPEDPINGGDRITKNNPIALFPSTQKRAIAFFPGSAIA